MRIFKDDERRDEEPVHRGGHQEPGSGELFGSLSAVFLGGLVAGFWRFRLSSSPSAVTFKSLVFFVGQLKG